MQDTTIASSNYALIFCQQAFPCISTGVYGFPSDRAAEIALETVRKWLSDKLDKVYTCTGKCIHDLSLSPDRQNNLLRFPSKRLFTLQ